MSSLPSRPRLRLRRAALAVALAGAVCLPGAAPAQEPGTSTTEAVRQAELDHEAARSAHEAAVAAYRAAQSLAERATDRLARITDEGEEGGAEARRRAMAETYARWVEVEQAQRRVEATEERLEAARETLVSALEARVEELVARAGSTDDEEEGRLLAALWEDHQNRIQELEAEAREEPTIRFAGTVVPEITIDPRDGPLELRQKAAFLEHRAALYDSTLVEIDAQIRELSRRDRHRAALQNFLRGIRRFDEGAVPIGREGRAAADRAEGETDREQGGGSDEDVGDEEAGAAPLTVEERIQQLEELREILEAYREQVLDRARRFREAIGRPG